MLVAILLLNVAGSMAVEDLAWTETRIFGGTELRHADSISTIQITPDGKQIITASYDGFCRVWDAESGSLIRELDSRSEIRSVLLLKDGRTLLVSLANGLHGSSIQSWDIPSGALGWRARSPLEARYAHIILGLDGDYTIVSTCEGIYRMNVKTGVCVRAIHIPQLDWFHPALSPDGKTVFYTIRSTAYLVDSKTFNVIWSREVEDQNLKSAEVVIFSHDGGNVYSVMSRGSLVLDSATGKVVSKTTSDGKQGMLHSAVALSDGVHALAVQRGNVVRWDLKSHAVEPLLPTGASWTLAVSPDETWVAVNFDQRAQRWDLKSKTARPGATGHVSPVYSIDISSDGTRIVSGCGSEPVFSSFEPDRVRVWVCATGREIWSVDPHCQNNIAAVRFSPDGKTVFATGSSKENAIRNWVFAWNAETGAEIFKTELLLGPPEGLNGVTSMELSSDGRELFVSTLESMTTLDAKTGREKHEYKLGDYVKTFTLLDHDKLLITADGGSWSELPGDLRLRFVNPASGYVLKTVPSLSTSTIINTWQVQATPDHRGFAAALTGQTWLRDPVTDELAFLLFYQLPEFPPVADSAEAADIKRLVRQCADDNVDIRDDATRHLAAKPPGVRGLLEAARVNAEPEAQGRIDSVLGGFAVQECPRLQQALDVGGTVTGIAISRDGGYFAAAVMDVDTTMVYFVTGTTPQTFNGFVLRGRILTRQFAPRHPQTLRFLPDGKSIIAGNRDGTLSLFEAPK